MKEIYASGTGLGILMGLIIIAVGIYTIIKLRKQVREKEDSYPKKPASELLKERYARGEISKEEYEDMRKNE